MNNNECIGYAIGALYKLLDEENKSFKVKKAYCEELENKLHKLFDIKTEYEANKIRKNIIFSKNNKEAERTLF